jgi:hypothetical protein
VTPIGRRIKSEVSVNRRSYCPNASERLSSQRRFHEDLTHPRCDKQATSEREPTGGECSPQASVRAPRPVGLIALWNCWLMQMVARRTLTAAFQSCFSAVGLTLATPYLTSFGDERVRAWGVDGLLSDKTRPPGKKPLLHGVPHKALLRTTNETPPRAAQWGVHQWCKPSASATRAYRAEAGLKLGSGIKRPQHEERMIDVVGRLQENQAGMFVVSLAAQVNSVSATLPHIRQPAVSWPHRNSLDHQCVFSTCLLSHTH